MARMKFRGLAVFFPHIVARSGVNRIGEAVIRQIFPLQTARTANRLTRPEQGSDFAWVPFLNRAEWLRVLFYGDYRKSYFLLVFVVSVSTGVSLNNQMPFR